MKKDVQNKLHAPPLNHESFGYDPVVKLVAEQQPFNDAWVGRKPQRGNLQRVGFFIISITFACAGLMLTVETYLAAKQGALYLFLMGVGASIVGSLGVIKALRR